MPLAALGPILAGAAGTSAAATTAAWGAIGAGGLAGANIYGANKQAGAASDAAAAQQKATAESLAFQKQQAEGDWRNQEVARKGNYDQYVAHQQSSNTVRRALGLGAIETPAYVPSVDPNYAGPNAPSQTPPPYVDWRTIRGSMGGR